MFIFKLIFKKQKPYLLKTENEAIIDEIYIYGNHLNLNGTIDIDKIDKDFQELKLIFYAKEPIEIPLTYKETEENIYFEISDKLNNGFLLDSLSTGIYNLYIEAINGKKIEYYKLNNTTKYDLTEYYSIRKNNKFNYYEFENKNDTISLNITPSNTKEIYDVVIDPGHGGVDKGACDNNYCETDFTYLISSKIKEKLEQHGLKVKLTRGDLSSSERLPNYGDNGRVNIANASRAKYLLAIHLNSNAYNDNGLEIYTAYNVDYTFASNLAKSIVKTANTNYSTNNAFKKLDGVYTRTFQNIDLNEAYETAIANNYKPYDVSNKTTYYFVIRETGGYMSGAYKDARDGTDYNYNYNSNVGIESYLAEIAYITSKKDLTNLNNNIDKYVDGIVDALLNEIGNEK